jgi:hypothetical protein
LIGVLCAADDTLRKLAHPVRERIRKLQITGRDLYG